MALWVGTRAVVWGGAIVMACAAAAIAIGPATLVLTISAAFAEGVGGGAMLAIINELVVNRFEERAAATLSGANVAASLASLAGPVIVAGLIAAEYGWRPMLLLPLLAVGLGFLVFGRLDTSSSGATGDLGSAPLGRAFWLRWLVLVLAIAIEFGTVFTVAPLLQGGHRLGTAASAGMLAWLIGGMLLGRIAGFGLSDWRVLHGRLLFVGLGVVMVGAIALWASPTLPVAVAGLVVAGTGIGTLYPEAIAAAVRSVPGAETAASARCSIGFGFALFLSPLVLGLVADAFDVAAAFVLVPILTGSAAVLWLVAETESAETSTP